MIKFLDDFITTLESHNISTEWVSFAVALTIIFFPLTSLIVSVLKWKKDKNKFNLEVNLAERDKKRLIIDEINKKLVEFYLPLRYFMLQSKMLYDTFAIEEKEELKKEGKRFNTLRYLCDGGTFNESDQVILDEIIKLGEEQNKLIESSNWASDELNLSELLSKYSAHLKILKAAKTGKLTGKINIYKSYTFPIELPGALESKIFELNNESRCLKETKYQSDKFNSIKKYKKHARRYFNETVSIEPSEDLKTFSSKIKSGGLVCDLGSGSGRDSIFLIQNGFRVFSIEPSEELASLAKSYPYLYVENMRAEDMIFISMFDAIWSSAVLQHINGNYLELTIEKIGLSLKKNGYLYLSFRATASLKERLFEKVTLHSIEKIERSLNKNNLSIINHKKTTSSKDSKNEFHSLLVIKN